VSWPPRHGHSSVSGACQGPLRGHVCRAATPCAAGSCPRPRCAIISERDGPRRHPRAPNVNPEGAVGIPPHTLPCGTASLRVKVWHPRQACEARDGVKPRVTRRNASRNPGLADVCDASPRSGRRNQSALLQSSSGSVARSRGLSTRSRKFGAGFNPLFPSHAVACRGATTENSPGFQAGVPGGAPVKVP